MTERRGVLAPLRYRDYRLVAVGSLVSLLGDGLFRVAISLQVYALDNDPRALAGVAVAWMGGQVLLLPLGGLASDRFPRRRVMIAADVWRGAVMLAIGLLSVTGRLQLWQLVVLGACFGAGNAFFNPAATSLVPDLLPEEELPRANAFLGVARPSMIWIVGPLLGGVVIGTLGTGTAFLIDGATFFASAALLLAVATRPVAAAGARRMRDTLREAGEGLRFVRRAPWAWVWLLATAISTLVWHGPFDILVPFLLLNDFGLSIGQAGTAMAVILAAGGFGSIIVSTIIGRRGLPRRFVTAMYVTEATGLLALLLFGLMTAVWQAAVAGLVLHTAFAVNEIVWTTMLQRLVPRGVLGRVSSLDWMTAIGLAPVSFALTGPLAAAFGARPVLVAAGAVGTTSVLALSLVRGARDPEEGDAMAPPPADAVATVMSGDAG